MDKVIPLQTFKVEEGRVYFVVRRLANHQLYSEDKNAYNQLKRLWDKFMAGPDSLSGITMPRELHESFRHLEALSREEKNVSSVVNDNPHKFKTALKKADAQ